MKIKSYLLLAVTYALLSCCIMAACEESAACFVKTGEEWSWSRGAYNTFSGTLDLTGCSGKELTVIMAAKMDYDLDSETKSVPVFTTVNGKRITMTKQSDTTKITPDPDNPQMEFTGSIRLPEKKRIDTVTFTFIVFGADGVEQKNVSCHVNSGMNSDNNSNTFYISADIGKVTLCFGIAAALVWTFVLLRKMTKKKQL